MRSLGYSWVGGRETVWRQLYAECIYKLAGLVGAPDLLVTGEWVDDTELEAALRTAGWSVHVPVRRRGLLARTSYGSLGAWKILGEEVAHGEWALSAGWSESNTPQQLCAYTLSTGSASPNDPSRPIPKASEGRVVVYDIDSVEISVDLRSAPRSAEEDILDSLVAHLRDEGSTYGLSIEVYRSGCS